MIKRYEEPNLPLDNEPTLKNITGCNINWDEGRSLPYRDINKNKISKSNRRAGKICTVNNRDRTD